MVQLLPWANMGWPMALKDALAEKGEEHVHTAGHQMMIDALQGFVLELPAYKKEIDLQQAPQSSSWPDQDVAALQKLQPSKKPTKHYTYMKLLCVLQILTPVWVQVTPTSKKRRLDPEDSDDALSSRKYDSEVNVVHWACKNSKYLKKADY
ncbi:hypothetical protein DEU56DRAFT_758559 [Suillus clintonianus]|uniref:uncharacterized protein n=1 Tax=Suillus clintonianus TaxID=1904413 RepID=UPI001B865DEA|nr:uncharacterized protein DEU56DRAFT_758559 [Suillus clintonianus]KAG2127672.1 hypothetical protein DEU56DRAFT_758559 [Suillus clintonianus]